VLCVAEIQYSVTESNQADGNKTSEDLYTCELMLLFTNRGSTVCFNEGLCFINSDTGISTVIRKYSSRRE